MFKHIFVGVLFYANAYTFSFEMIDAARNRLRVKACYVMMALTLLACLAVVISGKQVIKLYK